MFSPIAPPDATPSARDAEVQASFERIAIITDHLRVSYANGSSFASQFLRREFTRRGHQVTVVGPSDPLAGAEDMPEDCIALRSLPLRNHPGVQLPFPNRSALDAIAGRGFNIALGQTCTGMLELGVWLREMHRVPYVCVNTVHLPSVYNVLLPNALMKRHAVRRLFDERLIPGVEAQTVDAYNAADGLIVLSQGMKDYWLERGVRVPVTVIARSVEPKIFERSPVGDPFEPGAARGSRLLCVCRHTREKGLSQLLEAFATVVAPNNSSATLTLVGDGPDHEDLRRLAARLGVADRVYFPGEQPLTRVPDYYRHADLFLYTSLSDTYGQVVSEAAWCGLPCVALRDGRGVSAQISDGETGVLVGELGHTEFATEEYGKAVLQLLSDPARLRQMSHRAAELTRLRTAPDRCVRRYYQAFEEARDHLEHHPPQGDERAVRRRIARWAAVHATLVGLGYLRRRAVVNRNGSVQPNWHDLPASGPAPVSN